MKSFIRNLFPETINWYGLELVQFNYNNNVNILDWFYEKDIVDGMSIYLMIALTLICLSLFYLPVIFEELRKRVYNNTNLVITEDELIGTKSKFLKLKEYNICIKDINWIEIKKCVFKSFYGKNKLIIYANNKVTSIYYLQDINEEANKIFEILNKKEIKLEKESYKNRLKNIFSINYKKATEKTSKVYESLKSTTKDVVSKNMKSDLERKLSKIKELKENGTINEEEYEKIRSEVIKNAKL